jgi:CheY-like chemotaxis protein
MSEEKKPKILIVEDEYACRDLCHKGLKEALGEDGYIGLEATTHGQAEEIFTQNPDISVIIMDACLDGDAQDTLGLVKKFRETFKGPMIAASRLADYNTLLCNAGCDFRVKKSPNFNNNIWSVVTTQILPHLQQMQQLEPPQQPSGDGKVVEGTLGTEPGWMQGKTEGGGNS